MGNLCPSKTVLGSFIAKGYTEDQTGASERQVAHSTVAALNYSGVGVLLPVSGTQQEKTSSYFLLKLIRLIYLTMV